ncbi:hypothetical protein [Streptomyces abikoensis]|uniref:hypothetical protein n=1 Tax=Streptomyces abikoensis TaxID=97398 RepID=UPI00340F3887
MHRVPSAAVLVAVAMSAAVGCVSVSPRPLAPGGPDGPRAVHQGPARESLTVTGPGASRPPSPDGTPTPGANGAPEVNGAPGRTADPFRIGPYDPKVPADPKDPADPTMPWDPPAPSRATGGDQGARRSPDAPSLVAPPPPATDPGSARQAPSPERRAERQEPAPAPPEPQRQAPRPAPEPEERHAAPAPAPAPASRGQQGKGLCALGDTYGKWEKGGDASRICHQVYGR